MITTNMFYLLNVNIKRKNMKVKHKYSHFPVSLFVISLQIDFVIYMYSPIHISSMTILNIFKIVNLLKII